MLSVFRVCDASINTVSKLLEDTGETCMAFHDENVRGVKSERVPCDEIWSSVYVQAKTAANAKASPEDAEDCWTWTAIDADSKLIVSYLVGGRSAGRANEIMQDVAARLSTRVQPMTDGLRNYLDAAFGADIDYAQLVNFYGATPTPPGYYGPAECTGIKGITIEDRLDERHINTSYVERANLTMCMSMRRFPQLTNGFSTKVENHIRMVSLDTVWYNYAPTHETLKCSPAMVAGRAPPCGAWNTSRN